ncbi:ANTAR domain-containing protein [Streptomyces canus]|uniref:ANTAR domain-containing protein n=1 Tax=Streptomyces canus TaxID=58343 RepID=UPI00036274BD|nr:ANTAR domain-containing protein [Streptomyces canus]
MPEPAHSAQPLATLDARPPCLATIEAVPAGERMVVTCRGEFDIGAQGLEPELYAVLDRSATGVDLDLDEVRFCDCGGLNVLLSLRREALDQGKTVTVRAYSPVVGRLLELTGARELFVTEHSARPEGPGAVEEQPQPMDVDQELRLEVDQLRRAMRTRPAIDVARGIVMASFGLSAEDAWTVLVTASQNTNTKLHELAQELMGAIHGAAVPEQVQQQMAAAVAKVREQGPDQQGPDQQAPPPPAA